MAQETFLQNWIVAKFILPFFLMFFILFAILEKTEILGKSKKQLNALTSAVISLIFVSAVFPKEVVGNLILFLTISIIVVFVTLLIWGFVSGGEATLSPGIKKLAGISVVIAVIIAVFWAVGLRVEFLNNLIDYLFYSSWSSTFWTNASFIAVIAIALGLVLSGSKGKP